MEGSRFRIDGSTGRAAYVEHGNYNESHHHYYGDAQSPRRPPTPEAVSSLAAWIDRSQQVQEIEAYFRKRYALVERNGPVLLLLPSRSGDYGDLFIQRCARELVPRLVEDGKTINQGLTELRWPAWLSNPEEILIEFAKEREFTGCRVADEVVFRLGEAPANHYLVIEIDGRAGAHIDIEKVKEAARYLADHVPEITRPARLFVFMHLVCTDDYARPSLWQFPSLRRCRIRKATIELTSAFTGHERVLSLTPLDLVSYADYERWVDDLRRHRPDQLHYADVRDGWRRVFEKIDQRRPFAEVHATLREIIEEAYHRAANAA